MSGKTAKTEESFEWVFIEKGAALPEICEGVWLCIEGKVSGGYRDSLTAEAECGWRDAKDTVAHPTHWQRIRRPLRPDPPKEAQWRKSMEMGGKGSDSKTQMGLRALVEALRKATHRIVNLIKVEASYSSQVAYCESVVAAGQLIADELSCDELGETITATFTLTKVAMCQAALDELGEFEGFE